MEKQTYVMLRRLDAEVPALSNLGLDVRAGPSLSGPPVAAPVVITSAEMSKKDRDDARRDPRTVALAPDMPMSLIQPLANATPAADDGLENGVAWGVRAVGAVQSTFDGAGISVAVLDTGIDPLHPAFAGVQLVRRNFTTEPDDDLHGHGTHCAGTILGRDVNGVRIGVARGVNRAIIGKVLGKGGGSSVTIASAIQWALDQGANVISMSLGIDFPGAVNALIQRGMDPRPATSLALEGYRANVNLFNQLAAYVQARGAFGQGCLIVAASGNESERPNYEIAVAPPAAATGILAVGALARGPNGLTVASFSNKEVNLSAPGVNVRSAAPGGGLVSMNGTSMATPHVAGVAALHAQRILATMVRLDAAALSAYVVSSGTLAKLDPAHRDFEDVGSGLVQAP